MRYLCEGVWKAVKLTGGARAECGRRYAILFFKYLYKVIVIRVSHIIADFLDGQFGVLKHLGGVGAAQTGNIFGYFYCLQLSNIFLLK